MAKNDLLSVLGVTESRAFELVRPLVASSDGSLETKTRLLDRFALVCFTNLIEPGDRVARELCYQLGNQQAIARVAGWVLDGRPIFDDELNDQSQLSQAELSAALDRWKLRFSEKTFRNSFEGLAKIGSRVLCEFDREWPSGLASLEFHSPLALFAIGNLSLDAESRGVAIVGSRAISPYGRWVTKEFSEALVEANRPVISGGAFGVDAVAHQSALAVQGSTLSIMAGGLDRLYPSGNLELLKQVAKKGLVLAEVPPGFTPTKWRFLQRNRLIAAISQATVVIEAGHRSGSINTAHHALSLGRPVGAVPGSVAAATSQGCHDLIREGSATLVASPKHMLELVSNEVETSVFEKRLTADQVRVLDALGSSNLTEESIAKNSGIAVTGCRMVLAELELEGFVVRKNLKWSRTSRNL